MASSPFVWKNSLSLVWRGFEEKHLKQLRPFNGFAVMGVALADLSTGTAYGWNHENVGFAASLTKIAAMYAAFHLQAALIADPAAATLKLADLQKKLAADWRPGLKSALGSVPEKKDFPQITKIFKAGDAGFSFSKDFQHNLEEMIGPSSNEGARYCIEALGFDYLLGSLIYGGFYSLKDGKGLWLSGNYDGKADSRDGAEAPGVKSIKDASQRHQVATAAAVTLLMANLGKEQLISKSASIAMQGLMWDSYAGRKLGKAGSVNHVVGKIGIQPNNQSFHDCAIIERHCMKYAMTVLFMPNSGSVGSPKIDFGLFAVLDTIADELFASSRSACEAALAAPTKVKSFAGAHASGSGSVTSSY
jgi:hypothetical protein